MHNREIARSEPTMGWVVVVQLLYLEQEGSRMSRCLQVECAMTTPGLGYAIGFLAHMLVLLSRIVAPEQQPKSERKLFNHGDCKRTRDIPVCPALQPLRLQEDALCVARVRVHC